MSTASNTTASISEELSALFAEHRAVLKRHCGSRLSNEQDAEEVVQETFLNVWEFLARGQKMENPRAFLFRVANNLIIDRIRRKKSTTEVSLDALQEKGFDPQGDDCTGKMLKRMEARTILAALREMDQSDYNLMIRRFIDGMNPADIALETGMSANAVSVRLHRALKRMSSISSTRCLV